MERTFGELVDLSNIHKEFVHWRSLEFLRKLILFVKISIICHLLMYFYGVIELFYFFVSVAKENKEIIVWLKKMLFFSFLFSNSQHNLQSIKSK